MAEYIIRNLAVMPLLSGAAVLAVLAIRALTAERIHTRLLMVLWLILLVRLIIPVTLETPVHFGGMVQLPSIRTEASEAAPDMPAVSETSRENQSLTAAEISGGEEEIQRSVWTLTRPLDIRRIIFAGWGLGTAIFLMLNISHILRFKARVSKAKTDTRLLKLVEKQKHLIGIRCRVDIVISNCVDVPVVMGAIKPKILIPAGIAETLSETRIGMILTHELMHIKRHDIIKRYLWLWARSVHWFNPLVHVAYRAYLDDVELACDTAVSRLLGVHGRAVYSESLVAVVKQTTQEKELPVLVSFCRKKVKLRKRVEHMLKPKKISKVLTMVTILLMMVTVLACFTTACTNGASPTQTAGTDDGAETLLSEPGDKGADEASVTEDKEAQMLEKALSYRLTDSETVELLETMEYRDDWANIFLIDDSASMVRLQESDMGFISFDTKLHEAGISIDYSDGEIEEKVLGFINQYFEGEAATVGIVTIERDDVAYVECQIDDGNGTVSKVYIEINGKGELLAIGRLYDEEQQAGVQEAGPVNEDAMQIALESLDTFFPFAADRTELVRSYLDDQRNYPMEMFEFMYTSDNPNVTDYSFSATIGVKQTKEGYAFGYGHYEPVLEELDLLSEEEVIALAKQYIHEEYGVDEDKLKFKEFIVMTGRILEFQANFDYDANTTYGASMNAETGEKDGVGMGKSD